VGGSRLPPGRKDALYFSAWPQALRIHQLVRDEAHRFALRYHHQIKHKGDLHSVLDDIADIGAKRRKILLSHFGSAGKIKDATKEELQNVPGIGKVLAEKIFNALKIIQNNDGPSWAS
jgi:excinuclease ABC subunit C